VLASRDDYATTAKPVIDWDDAAAREALVDSRARDGYAVLAALDGRTDLSEPVAQAAQLLATVLGQDPETGEDRVTHEYHVAHKPSKKFRIWTLCS
jgi:hypothetical protein